MSNARTFFPILHEGLSGLSRVSIEQLEYLIMKMPMIGRYLEIGSASGVTASLIARARPGLTVVCVDLFCGANAPECLAEEGDRFLNWRANKRPNMHLWFGTSGDLCASLRPGARFDVILVDADHTYGCTLTCLRDASLLVSYQGIILVHDWGAPAWPEVEPAGLQFCREQNFEIVESFSCIRALRRKREDEIPEPRRQLQSRVVRIPLTDLFPGRGKCQAAPVSSAEIVNP